MFPSFVSKFFLADFPVSNTLWTVMILIIVGCVVATDRLVRLMSGPIREDVLDPETGYTVVSPFLIPETRSGAMQADSVKYAVGMKVLALFLALIFVIVPFFEFLPHLDPYWWHIIPYHLSQV